MLWWRRTLSCVHGLRAGLQHVHAGLVGGLLAGLGAVAARARPAAAVRVAAGARQGDGRGHRRVHRLQLRAVVPV